MNNRHPFLAAVKASVGWIKPTARWHLQAVDMVWRSIFGGLECGGGGGGLAPTLRMATTKPYARTIRPASVGWVEPTARRILYEVDKVWGPMTGF